MPTAENDRSMITNTITCGQGSSNLASTSGPPDDYFGAWWQPEFPLDIVLGDVAPWNSIQDSTIDEQGRPYNDGIVREDAKTLQDMPVNSATIVDVRPAFGWPRMAPLDSTNVTATERNHTQSWPAKPLDSRPQDS